MQEDGACPGCGEPAQCGMANGEPTCWCFELPPLLPMPAEKNARCYCRKCLEKLASEYATRASAGKNGSAR